MTAVLRGMVGPSGLSARAKRKKTPVMRSPSTSYTTSTSVETNASPAGMCFDAACQATQDRAFVAGVLLPLAAAVAAGAFVWNQPSRPPQRPPPSSSSSPVSPAEESAAPDLFEDPSTGTIFEARPGERPPERDRRGELAFRAVSFTPTPLPEGSPGDRVRVEVGEVASRKTPRTYVFERRLPQPSKVIAVSLARPAGVVFAESKIWGAPEKVVVVDELLAGSPAARRAAAAALDPALSDSAVLPGDLLRGFSTTNFVFRGAGALLGIAPPSRELVVFGADGQGWKAVTAALRRGSVSDGDVTLIVERSETEKNEEE